MGPVELQVESYTLSQIYSLEGAELSKLEV